MLGTFNIGAPRFFMILFIMVIDIRQILLWRAEQDLFLAWLDNRGYNISQAENRIVRIKQGIGFR
jgi:hypothetical protein